MISSVKNLKIKEYLKLLKNAKFRKKKESLAIEGLRLIYDALDAGVDVKELFLTRSCMKKSKNGEYCLAKYSNFQIISDEVAKNISLVEHNQGAFAIVEKPTNLNENDIKKTDCVLALCEIADPGNLGTLLRTALAFNFTKILTHNCCDIYNDKVVRSSMGAVFKVRVLDCENIVENMKNLKNRSIKIFATTTKKAAACVESLHKKSGVLILGGEARGLPIEMLKMADCCVKINMIDSCESLNVACAGSILMHEMKKF